MERANKTINVMQSMPWEIILRTQITTTYSNSEKIRESSQLYTEHAYTKLQVIRRWRIWRIEANIYAGLKAWSHRSTRLNSTKQLSWVESRRAMLYAAR